MSRTHVKCRWCKWSAPLWRRTQGRRKSGYDFLAAHVSSEHTDLPEALAALDRGLDYLVSKEANEHNDSVRATWDVFPTSTPLTTMEGTR